MTKEIICINVGQAGVQISNAYWALFCIEHGLDSDGWSKSSTDLCPYEYLAGLDKFFSTHDKGNLTPRAINIDLEPTVIDEIRTGPYRNLWHPDCLLNIYDDGCGLYARGYFSIGRKIIQKFYEEITRLYEACDNLHGFIITNSYGGGTGSGLTGLIYDKITNEVNKKTKVQSSIFPSNKMCSSPLEPYNCILASMTSSHQCDLVMAYDNEAMYNACYNRLNIDKPTFFNINTLNAQLISSLTVTMRFGSTLDHDLTHLQTNLVPYPAIHFPISSFAPMHDHESNEHEFLTTNKITNDVFDNENSLIKCDLTEGKFMSCCLHYRGSVVSKNVNEALQSVKNRLDITFVDWCPTGFKVGISSMPPTSILNSSLVPTNKNCSLFTNNSAIETVWTNIIQKYQKLYRKKAFLFWFFGEGMEESEFEESHAQLKSLINDYDEIAREGSDKKRETNKKEVSKKERPPKLSQQNISSSSNASENLIKTADKDIYGFDHLQQISTESVLKLYSNSQEIIQKSDNNPTERKTRKVHNKSIERKSTDEYVYCAESKFSAERITTNDSADYDDKIKENQNNNYIDYTLFDEVSDISEPPYPDNDNNNNNISQLSTDCSSIEPSYVDYSLIKAVTEINQIDAVTDDSYISTITENSNNNIYKLKNYNIVTKNINNFMEIGNQTVALI